MKVCLVERDIPGHDEVRVEAGETVPGRTDSNIWEVQVSDGAGLDGGGDWTVGPDSEGLVDQKSGYSEATEDNEHPEQFDESSGGRNVGQAMDGRGLQEVFDPGVHAE